MHKLIFLTGVDSKTKYTLKIVKMIRNTCKTYNEKSVEVTVQDYFRFLMIVSSHQLLLIVTRIFFDGVLFKTIGRHWIVLLCTKILTEFFYNQDEILH